MDFIIYTAVTIIVWTLSVTCLLPFVVVLKISKTYRDKWFSWVFVRVIGGICGPALARVRKRGFKFLEEQLPERKSKAPLEILEIGFGGGFNLPFYPKNSNLTALDMNESFIKYFEESRQKNPHVTYKKVVIAMAEDMREIEDDSFDVVVCTYVLCSVESVRSALKEVKRVLKPGGKFLFVEHILYPNFNWKAMLQILTNPIWRVYFNGCNINRNHDEEIKKAGFSDVVTEMCYRKDIWLYVRPMMIGVATK
ncbi:Methyltransferase-like protein 7B [Araneus ventricosus]|uniref:Methyltransferase-like protein 7B n=1 Tax=Araneus ventricosus TaxID=182803 RepID=A0A4Y2FPB3_ARAVE|nr:Methyltransferase-like protein 7B [Araneus ventricosus]